MVRAERMLEIIHQEKLVMNAEKMGVYLLKMLEKVQMEFTQTISNARGRGLMMAFDLRTAEERNNLAGMLFKNGLAVLGCGEKSIRFRPHMTLKKEEADYAIEILRKTLKKFSK
jgi:L-lysine 6-transaminase